MSKRVNFSEYEKQIIQTYVKEYAHIIEDLKNCDFFPGSSLGNRIQNYMELDHTSCTLYFYHFTFKNINKKFKVVYNVWIHPQVFQPFYN